MSSIVGLRNPFEHPFSSHHRNMATLQTGSPKSNISDSGNITSPGTSMGPPSHNSPEAENNPSMTNGSSPQQAQHHMGQTVNAASVSQGPKVVQTAFIHKLYSMLEDRSISHLITWTPNGDSFMVSPTNEFSKVLAQYFKHTNISSFVRQLNMYGFHKVSDVFHTGGTESALWEFKHGNGNFRKGDLMGLKDIKRRASRHTLIHRDSFSSPIPGGKPAISQPGTPAEPIPDPDQRLAHVEAMFYDLHARLNKAEDDRALMSSRCQSLAEGIGRCHQWIHQLSTTVLNASTDMSIRHDMTNMQKEIDRQQELLRSFDQPEPAVNGRSHSYYPTNMAMDGPLSPRGYAFDSRRSSMQLEPPAFASRPPVPPLPPHFSAHSPHRLGSISTTQTSPGFARPALPPPTQPHPLSNVQQPPPSNLARRHTSADIREHGWPLPNPEQNGSPYAPPGINPVQWQPSSPTQLPQTAPGDEALQSQLANYQINGSRRTTVTALDQDPLLPEHSQPLPPPTNFGTSNGSWGPSASKFPRPGFELHSAPSTRRSSMVHSLLNPAVTVEQENEDDNVADDRKRKRLI